MRIRLILFFLFVSAHTSYAQQITYYKDIEPVIHTNCVPCHHPDKAAPFSLLTYNDVAKRVSFIKDVVQSRYMPPWKADNKYVHFVNDRSLSRKDIDLIIKWIDTNAGEGKKP